MLVLSRKCGETVRIGRDVAVTVLAIRGQVVKIGIEAPALIRVLRGELWGGDHPKELVEDNPGHERAALSVGCSSSALVRTEDRKRAKYEEGPKRRRSNAADCHHVS